MNGNVSMDGEAKRPSQASIRTTTTKGDRKFSFFSYHHTTGEVLPKAALPPVVTTPTTLFTNDVQARWLETTSKMLEQTTRTTLLSVSKRRNKMQANQADGLGKNCQQSATAIHQRAPKKIWQKEYYYKRTLTTTTMLLHRRAQTNGLQ